MTDAMTEGDRQEWVQATFESGKKLYDRGDYDSAFREWDKLGPYFSENTVLKKVVDYLKQQAKNKKLAAATAVVKTIPSALSKKTPRASTVYPATSPVTYPPPPPKSDFKRAEILYYQGKYEEAVAIWDNLLPTLDPGSEEQILIERLKENYANTLAAKRDVEKLEAKDGAAAAPPDLKTVLLKADKKFRALAQESETARKEAEQRAAEREARTIALYQSGKDAFAEDRWEEALKNWEKLAGMLGDGSEEKRLILSLSENYSKAKAAKNAAGEWEKKTFEPPKSLKEILRLAGERLKAEIQNTESARLKAEKEFSEKQNRVNALIQKGRDLYNSGDIRAAVAAWREMFPFFDDKREFEGVLSDLERNYATLQGLAMESKAAAASQKIAASPEIRKLWEEAGQKMKAEGVELLARQKEAESDFATKRGMFESTAQKGKRLYYEGSVKEAFEVWQGLLSYFPPGSPEQSAILGLKGNYEGLEAARQDLAALKIRQAEELKKAFADLDELLNKANERLKSQLTEVENQRESVKASAKKGPSEESRLEFVSGKITSIDKAEGKMTLALHTFGDEKSVTVKIGEATKMDGLKNKYTLDSLQNGLEVDVRYNRRTGRAAYIYIY